MLSVLLFVSFLALIVLGIPVALGLAVSAIVVVVIAGVDMPWFGLFTVQQSFDAAIGKYPLLALPMFILVGSVFDRSGVAQRMVNFAVAIVGRKPGKLPIVVILVAMVLGGISGSGAALAAAIGGVMVASMSRAGYPRPFTATVIGSATAADILIPPSIGFVIYSILMPNTSLPALFAAGMFPGILAGIALMVPAYWLSRRHGLGANEGHEPKPALWPAFKEASWGLVTPVLILGGMRAGWFTPTEAAVVAAVYVLFIGMVVHRTIRLRDLVPIFADAMRISALIMAILGMAAIFSYCVNTMGLTDPVIQWVASLDIGSTMALIVVLLIIAAISVFLDGTSVLMIFVPMLVPIIHQFGWDPILFGVLAMMVMAIGQFTPPMAMNLLVACKVAKTSIEATLPWVPWFIVSFAAATVVVGIWPEIALWLPRVLGYL
ncbi:TRAP transporter large permease [Lampropedia aestuarii]|uniref:TRAP transporter large permease n=1 Tax=Lampropedia aestuarii TaxID=2562762 RepID=UPI00246844AB|nr:TRAP transporter large permease [Lampropedia aestuarii]MDH5859206.1 TRAP transporter large permease [Lampropedia aestuarii]